VLFHAAGSASVGASFQSPLEDLQTAILTWSNTLEGVRRSGHKPLILFPSSAAVYGEPINLPVSEEHAIAPISPYGFHKAACELVAHEYSECFGLQIIACRLFSVFGPGQRRLLIWELYQQLVGPDSTVWLQGTGKESRDYLCIDDLCSVLLHLSSNSLIKSKCGRYLVINIARGEETEVLKLAERLCSLLDLNKTIRCEGLERSGDPKRWCADVSLLRTLHPSWQPQPLDISVAQCLGSWEKERKVGRPHGF
jgi:UDP-glucose 4-epimerase